MAQIYFSYYLSPVVIFKPLHMTYGSSKDKNEILKSYVVAPACNPQYLGGGGKKTENLIPILSYMARSYLKKP